MLPAGARLQDRRASLNHWADVESAPTILVFNSGLGGLTVYREIARARPHARYIYVADDAYFPYGRHGEASSWSAYARS